MLPDDYAAPHKAIKDEICLRIADGETLRSICREEGKPHFTTVYDWLQQDEDFALRFARAREVGHDVIAEDCLSIADGQSPSADTQRDKLRVDTRLKLLSKWSPKYAERVKNDIQHFDKQGNPTNPPSALPESIAKKLDAIADAEF